MRNLTAEIRAFLHDEEGVTMIEYVLIAALIAVVCIPLFTSIGTELVRVLTKIRDELVKVPTT